MLRYGTARANMRILELENGCTGNRTVGSNPTLSATNRDLKSGAIRDSQGAAIAKVAKVKASFDPDRWT
jgi:hypothetical protein